jgi:hypothetical protein
MGRPQLGFPRLRLVAGRAGGIAIGPDHTPPWVTVRQDNETAILSKWRTSHTARLPKFFNVTRQTSGDCHHDFRLGFSSGRKLKAIRT